MSAITYCCLLLLAAVASTHAVTCFYCHYAESDSTSNSVLASMLSSFTSGSEQACADGTDTTTTTCSMCSTIDGRLTLTVAGQSITISSLSKGCHHSYSGSSYSSYNAVGCYDYDDTNPYASDVLASLSNSIVSVEVSGSQCLCDTVLCNGAPVVGASVMGALLLALMSLVASY